MTYNCSFKLGWKPTDNYKWGCEHKVTGKFCSECGAPQGRNFKKLNESISKFLYENRDTYYGIDEYGNGADACSWYDHTKDVLNLSKKFPEVLFTLSIQAREDTFEIWNEYFLNGKYQIQKAVVTIPSINEHEWKASIR